MGSCGQVHGQVRDCVNTLKLKREQRPWGWFQVLYQSPGYWTKLLCVFPGESLSLQYHENRSEYWVPLEHGLRGTINGNVLDLEPDTRYDVMPKVLHRVTNYLDKYPAQFIEVATGAPREEDIVRIHDKYRR